MAALPLSCSNIRKLTTVSDHHRKLRKIFTGYTNSLTQRWASRRDLEQLEIDRRDRPKEIEMIFDFIYVREGMSL